MARKGVRTATNPREFLRPERLVDAIEGNAVAVGLG